MTPRERMLTAVILVLVVLAGGGFLFYRLFLVPLDERNASILTLQQEIARKQDRIAQVIAERPKLERWRQLSLPADTDMARREYEKYLTELLRDSGFEAGAFSVTPKPVDTKSSPAIPGKGPAYTKLTFTAIGHASLGNVVKMLERFYRTGLLHQIKNISLQRPLTATGGQRREDLDLNFTVEALVLSGADNRPYLLPNLSRRVVALDGIAALCQAPVGLALGFWSIGPAGPRGPGSLAEPEREYTSVAAKNIFFGPTEAPSDRKADEVEATRFVELTDITQNDRRWEAFLYDQYNNKKTRLRAEPGFDTFRIQDATGETKLRGKVVRIDPRDVIFKVEKNYHSLHIGQTLEESMKQSLTSEQLRTLGLAALTEKPAPAP